MPAEIIPFPCCAMSANQPPSDATSDSNAAQNRLRLALDQLDAAMTLQRHSVAAWRQALARLQTSVHKLDASMRGYRGALDSLQTDVLGVNAQAKTLEHWADGSVPAAQQAR